MENGGHVRLASVTPDPFDTPESLIGTEPGAIVNEPIPKSGVGVSRSRGRHSRLNRSHRSETGMGGPVRFLHNPVLSRELLTRMRGSWWRSMMVVNFATIAVILAIFLVQHSRNATEQTTHPGIALFQAMVIFQLMVLFLLIPVTTSGTISRERQRGTWDLLLGTRLSSFDIVWGKLVAAVAFNLLVIVATLPLYGAIALFGGVSLGNILPGVIILFLTTVLLTTLSLFFSAVTRRPAFSLALSLITSLLLTFGGTVVLAYINAATQDTDLPPINQVGLPTSLPAPLAQVNPLLALFSALPNGNVDTMLSGVTVPFDRPLWQVYGLWALIGTVILVLLSTLLVRSGPPWLRRSGV